VLVRVIGRRWAGFPGLLLVLLFVVMTGASASLSGAAVMAVITQLALFLGRRFTLAIAVVHGLDYALAKPTDSPSRLRLSTVILATVGLMFLSKPIETMLTTVPDTLGVRQNWATTLAQPSHRTSFALEIRSIVADCARGSTSLFLPMIRGHGHWPTLVFDWIILHLPIQWLLPPMPYCALFFCGVSPPGTAVDYVGAVTASAVISAP